MPEAMTGREFLMRMKKQSGKKGPGFTDFSDFIENKAREKGIFIRQFTKISQI